MRAVSGLMVVLVFSLFMGVTAISMGVGAVFPAINRIAEPILCPGGTMVADTFVQRPLPGRTYVSSSYACVDRTGARTPLSYVAIVAGPMHGLCLFVGLAPLVLLGALRRRRAMPPPVPPGHPSARF